LNLHAIIQHWPDLLEDCSACRPVREAFDLLQRELKRGDVEEYVKIKDLQNLAISCTECEGRGVCLTAKGVALQALLNAFLESCQPGEKIPF
jgi:hypothetical protein